MRPSDQISFVSYIRHLKNENRWLLSMPLFFALVGGASALFDTKYFEMKALIQMPAFVTSSDIGMSPLSLYGLQAYLELNYARPRDGSYFRSVLIPREREGEPLIQVSVLCQLPPGCLELLNKAVADLNQKYDDRVREIALTRKQLEEQLQRALKIERDLEASDKVSKHESSTQVFLDRWLKLQNTILIAKNQTRWVSVVGTHQSSEHPAYPKPLQRVFLSFFIGMMGLLGITLVRLALSKDKN